MSLRIDWCGHDAAKHAVMNWHYSKKMPSGKNAYLGVWENERYRGAMIFGQGGGSGADGRRFGLKERGEVVELVRVALTRHETHVSRLLSISCRMIKKRFPGIRVVVSFADPAQGHRGGIYQAAGWSFLGRSAPGKKYLDACGKWHHERDVNESGVRWKFGSPRKSNKKSSMVRCVTVPGKYRYALGLDEEMRKVLASMALTYPKSVGSAESGTPVPTGRSGANPTPTLQIQAGDSEA